MQFLLVQPVIGAKQVQQLESIIQISDKAIIQISVETKAKCC